MKKILKSAGLPIGVFALAIGGAFATNAMKNADPNDRVGYYFDVNAPIKCMPKEDCTTIEGITCTWEESPTVSHDLYELQGTSCVKKLYKK